MPFLYDKCTLKVYDSSIHEFCEPFNCGNDDLDEFFSKDVTKYTDELLGKSYCFTLDEDERKVVAAFTISNDSIKTFTLPNSRKKKVNSSIPRIKQMKSYPAVLIGRLGVNASFRNVNEDGKTIGDQLMDFIKSWFIDKANKTGCRFIVVDSYNELRPLNYYKRNGFVELFSTEEQEMEYTGVIGEEHLATRLLYFDLIILSKSS